MFELSLCVNELDVDYLEKKLPQFRDKIVSLGGIFNISRNLQNVYFLIATEKEIEAIKNITISFICDCIRENLKKQFISELLNVKCSDDVKLDTLIEALVNFDRATDDAYIKRRIKLNGEFYINSFYMFKLSELKNKWKQLVVVTNSSGSFINNEELYLEILHYLIDGIELGDDTVIEKIDNSYVTKINESNVFCKIDTTKNLLNFLIKNNPKKIIIKSIDNDTLQLISQIFGKRLEQG